EPSLGDNPNNFVKFQESMTRKIDRILKLEGPIVFIRGDPKIEADNILRLYTTLVRKHPNSEIYLLIYTNSIPNPKQIVLPSNIRIIIAGENFKISLFKGSQINKSYKKLLAANIKGHINHIRKNLSTHQSLKLSQSLLRISDTLDLPEQEPDTKPLIAGPPIAAQPIPAALIPANLSKVQSAKSWIILGGDFGFVTVPDNTTVRYGRGSRWITKLVSGKFQVIPAFFGRDPYPNKKKTLQAWL
ncbi:MAG: hypothetical protein WD512_15145, partial [Candidatus Paceibacterota bacterium]